MKKIILFIFIILLMISCSVSKKTTSNKVETIKTVKSDNTVNERSSFTEMITHTKKTVSRPDKAAIKAKVKVDKKGNISLSIIDYKAGKDIKPSIQIIDNEILFNSEIDSVAVFETIKRRIDTTQYEAIQKIDINEKKNTESEVNKETSFTLGPKITLTAGGIIVLIILVLLYLIKKKGLFKKK